MTTTSSPFCSSLSPARALFRVIALGVVVAFLTISTTGCGVVGRGLWQRNSSELSAAIVSPLSTSKRTPTQMALRSSRVLPRPDFGVTPEVQAELDRFMTRERATVMRVLDENAHQYEATKKVFEGQGVPTELLSVAAVESGFNPAAASPAGPTFGSSREEEAFLEKRESLFPEL